MYKKQIESKSFINQILNSIHVGIMIIDVKTKIVDYVNKYALEIINRSRKCVEGKVCENFLCSEKKSLCPILDMNQFADNCRCTIFKKDGSVAVINKSSVLIQRNDKQLLLESFMDISKQVENEELLRLCDNKFRTIFMNTGVASILIASDMTILLANNEFMNLMMIKHDEIKSRPLFTNFFHKEDIEKLILYHHNRRVDFKSAPRNYEIRGLVNNNKVLHLYVTVAMVPETDQSIATFVDITEYKLARQLLISQAYTDGLTGLANRSQFINKLDCEIVSAKDKNCILGIALLDLDEFKDVNDSLGHSAGDSVLVEVSGRLKSVLRNSDVLARLGGDEFVILFSDLSGANDLADICRKLLQVIDMPFIIDGSEFFLSVSIGLGLFPHDGESPERLLQCADMAMYRAKSIGKNTFKFYTESLNEEVVKRANFENNLRLSLNENRVVAHYQPIVSLINRRVVSFEALARVVMNDGSVILNADFIAMAEKSALITKVDTAVLNHACSWISSLNAIGFKNIKVAVNVSARHLLRENFISKIRNSIKIYGIDPTQLEIEITETAVMENLNHANRTLIDLRDMGIDLSLDDFGTGYSSLSYLRHLPVQKLKIDKSFTSRYDTVDGSELLVTIVNLAKNLGLNPLAEGVETEEQALYLCKIGCTLAQGWLFSKAVPSCDAEYFVLNPELYNSI